MANLREVHQTMLEAQLKRLEGELMDVTWDIFSVVVLRVALVHPYRCATNGPTLPPVDSSDFARIV